jgi:hypothetical protein
MTEPPDADGAVERTMVRRVLVATAVFIAVAFLALRFTVIRDSGSETGDEAVWQMNPFEPPPRDGSTFRASVTRVGCNGGVTGRVLPPSIEKTAEVVTVTFSVEKIGAGAHTCPGGPPVPYDVDIGEPIGNRSLVDGACVNGSAASMSLCIEDDGVRLPADDHFPYVLTFRECAKPGSASRLAVQLDLDTVAPAAVAEAVAQKFPANIHQNATQGCLDALEGRVQKYEH